MSLRRFWETHYLAALSVTCAQLSLLSGHTPCSVSPRAGVLAELGQEPGPKAGPDRDVLRIGRALGMLPGSGRLEEPGCQRSRQQESTAYAGSQRLAVQERDPRASVFQEDVLCTSCLPHVSWWGQPYNHQSAGLRRHSFCWGKSCRKMDAHLLPF